MGQSWCDCTHSEPIWLLFCLWDGTYPTICDSKLDPVVHVCQCVTAAGMAAAENKCVDALTTISSQLQDACSHGNVELVRKILQDLQFDSMTSDSEGNTPLHLAAQSGHLGVVKEIAIWDNSRSSAGRNNMGQTPLHLASMHGHPEVVRTLASQYPTNLLYQNNQGDTPLHLAALLGHEEVVEILCTEFHCSPCLSSSYGRTPLHHACSRGHLSIVRKLITDYDCNPAACGDDGNAPLHCAAYY